MPRQWCFLALQSLLDHIQYIGVEQQAMSYYVPHYNGWLPNVCIQQSTGVHLIEMGMKVFSLVKLKPVTPLHLSSLITW